MDIQKILGSNIRKHRLAANLSQEELAARMNMDQGYISRLEAGHKNPTVLTIQQIALALDTDIQKLFASQQAD